MLYWEFEEGKRGDQSKAEQSKRQIDPRKDVRGKRDASCPAAGSEALQAGGG